MVDASNGGRAMLYFYCKFSKQILSAVKSCGDPGRSGRSKGFRNGCVRQRMDTHRGLSVVDQLLELGDGLFIVHFATQKYVESKTHCVATGPSKPIPSLERMTRKLASIVPRMTTRLDGVCVHRVRTFFAARRGSGGLPCFLLDLQRG